ncbi:MAG: biotin/lipoyl-binding protein [bacterium]|nr:biotin/lipoyl-binding protein [bacterium]
MSYKKLSIIGSLIVLAVGASVAVGATMDRAKKAEKNEQAQQQPSETRLPIETAGNNSLSQLSDASGSWPGELVSPTILEVHPQSEGSIIQLAVRVGQKVSQGDVIARLSPPPASVERASVAAEKKEALIRARANAEATEKVVTKSREQLLEGRKSLIPARDAAISLAQKDVERSLYMNNSTQLELEKMKKDKAAAVELTTKERDSARVTAGLKDRELRTTLEQAIENDLTVATGWSGSNLRQFLSLWNFRPRAGVGVLDSSVKNEYETVLGKVLRALYSSPTTPIEDSAIAYGSVAKKLSYASTSSGGDFSDTTLTDWKKDTRENQMALTTAVAEKRESEAMAEVKDAELAKMITDQDKEITTSSINVRQSQINSESNEIAKKKSTIDGELEYQNRKREVDIRLSELDRELELAQKDIGANEQSYATFLGQLSTQEVRAQRSGVISGIFKNTGDYVTPEAVIASISQEVEDDSFVRFRIPSDSQRPEVGSEVIIIRPGFPFDRQKAIVSGVGGAVGSQGTFIADAEFVEPIDWPIHALVRVMPSQPIDTVFVPFTALVQGEDEEMMIVTVDKDGKAEMRSVKAGKAVGDTVEIIEGLQSGEKYISRKLSSDILDTILTGGIKAVEGMTVEESDTPAKGEKTPMDHGEM